MTTDGVEEAPDPLRTARREAASRRKELRAAETELAATTDTIASLQRQVAEGMIRSDATLPNLNTPADLFAVGGVSLDDITDDTGSIDPGKLRDALTELQTTRDYLFSPRPGTSAYVGTLYAAHTAGHIRPGPLPSDTGTSWQRALSPTGVIRHR